MNKIIAMIKDHLLKIVLVFHHVIYQQISIGKLTVFIFVLLISTSNKSE